MNPPQAQAPKSGSLRPLLPLLAIMAALLLLVLALATAARWLLFSEDGARWVLARTPYVQAQGVQGALLGPRWQVRHLRLQMPGGPEWLSIDDLDASGLRWQWRPHEYAWIGLEVQDLRARVLTIDTGPAGPRPLPLPDSLAWPLHLKVAQAQLQTLQIDDLVPASALQAQTLELDPRPGAQHSVQQATLQWHGLLLQAGARIGTAAPLPLQAQGTLRPAASGDAPAWAAVLQVGGEVPAMQLTATLRGVPRGDRDAPTLDVRAQLQVLQRWPLAALDLQTQALDLSALWDQAPQTRLSGQATLASTAANAPMQAQVELVNAQPGRWDAGKLPVRQLRAQVQGRLDQPERITLPSFELELADATRDAGRLRGSAHWQGHEISLRTQVQALAPQRLDSHAAAMLLSGPVDLTLQGMPSPDPGAKTTPPPQQADWKLDLQGQLEAAPQPVRLHMQGRLNDQGLDLQHVHLSSGPASAELAARVQRAGRSAWKLQTNGKLADFDPLPWWPGEAGGAWRQGPHRLSGDWQLDVQVPADVGRLPPLALAQRVAGNGTLHVRDSLLAGVPVTAELTLSHAQADAPTPAVLRGELSLAGNRLTLQGRGDPAGVGSSDRLSASLRADKLASLAPLARLHPDLADWLPRQGSANAEVAVDGRWPELRSQGSLQLEGLQAGKLGLARAQATWQMDLSGDQPLLLQAQAEGLQWGTQRVQQLRGETRGTLADHRIDMLATLPASPPAELLRMLGAAAPQSGTQASLQAQGVWRRAATGGGVWQTRVDRIVVGPWSADTATGSAASLAAGTAAAVKAQPPAPDRPASAGEPSAAQAAAGWLAARDLAGELAFGPGGELLSLHADAGRLLLAQHLALRWDDVRVQLDTAQPQVRLRARIEAFEAAPLLARLQPGMGWQGDLRLAASLDIRAGERMDADVVFERQDGDLHLAGADGVQIMGLSEARLSLTAHDGLWLFTPVLKGRIVGDIGGSVRVQTTPERRWPAGDATLQGQLQANVADIGIWNAWLPPGWRLTGEIHGMATLGGTLAEQRYTGQISGSKLAVRNLLLGVNISDGEVAVRLDGDKAQIERFTLRSGDGSLSLTGGATLGSAAQARLQIKADHFRALARVDRSLTASGNAELTLTPEQGRLEGRIKVDEGFFDASQKDAPSLDSDVTVRQLNAPQQAADEAPEPRRARNFVLGLDIDLGHKLQVRGRGLDTKLSGVVRLTAPAGRLAVNGSIHAVDGTYAAWGQNLEIERGVIEFNGPLDNPRLDVLALRPLIDNRVGLLISGNLLTMRVRLYSDPELPESEKISWLVLGRASDGLGRSDTALIQRAAVALMAGEGEAPSDKLLKNLGIDELSLRQGEGEMRETVVTLGKQLSRRWYLGYERGLNATTGTWQLIYRIAQRFTLRAQSGLDNSLDVIWTWRTQPPPEGTVRKSTQVPP